MKKQFYLIGVAMLLALACKKDSNDDDDTNPGGNNNGPVTITGIDPELVFWGDELTINGSGFSTTKADNFVWFLGDNDCGPGPQDSTGWKKAEIVSASDKKLVVKVPYTSSSGMPCGPSLSAQVRLTVKGKETVVAPKLVRPMGFPSPGEFCPSYGAYVSPTIMRPGDSVMLTYNGFGMINLHNSGNQDKIRLKVDNKIIPITLRSTGCGSYRLTFKLDIADFAKAECSPVVTGWGYAGEVRTFKLYMEGKDLAMPEKERFVTNLPKGIFLGAIGPTVVSKAGTLNPFWTVTGKNMTYHKVVYTALQPCSGNTGDLSTLCNGFCDEFKLQLPLSLMNVGCTYSIHLIDVCGVSKGIGTVKIIP